MSIIELVICMSTLLALTSTVRAEILSPPTHIPFAKDAIIDKYAHGNPLNLFTRTGKWKVKAMGQRLTLVGASDKASAYLLSTDKLSNKPKSFKFDFLVSDINKEYGFIYGNTGVMLFNNQMVTARFDSKTNQLKADATNNKVIVQIAKGKPNTLDIHTGYDPTGGPNQVCVIYINGIGLPLDCPKTDSTFGVYLGPKNGIEISNVRWGIGSK